MRRSLIIVAGLVVTLVTALAAPAAADDHKLTGTLTLEKFGFGDKTSECHGSDVGDGYGDIDRGARVVIRDDERRTIATSRLGAGKVVGALLYCRWPFTVKVPDASSYEIAVAHRGGRTYSKKRLEHQKWKVAFSVGDGV
jgi:hypothetical protein